MTVTTGLRKLALTVRTQRHGVTTVDLASERFLNAKRAICVSLRMLIFLKALQENRACKLLQG